MDGRLLAVVLLAVSCQSAGQAMQKRGVTSVAPQLSVRCLVRRLPGMLYALACSWSWVTGVALGVLGAALAVEALASGELVTVVPLLNLTVVATALIGMVAFRERLTPVEVSGTGVVVVGAMLLATQSDASPTGAVHLSSAFSPWLAASGATIALALVVGTRGCIASEAAGALTAGVMYGFGNLLVKLAVEAAESRCGAFRITKGSCAAALLSEPLAYALLATELTGFAFLQTAYSVGRLTVVGILKTTSSIWASATLGSLVLGETIDGSRAVAALMIVGGTALLGVRQRQQEQQERT